MQTSPQMYICAAKYQTEITASATANETLEIDVFLFINFLKHFLSLQIAFGVASVFFSSSEQ